MSKRKLTRQQAFRINRIQEERIARAQKREENAQDMLRASDLSPEQEGLIIAHYGTQLDIEDELGSLLRCHIRANLEHLVTGDRVIFQRPQESEDALGVVTALLPRKSVLIRPDPYGKLKPVAANIDRIILVISPFPEPSPLLIDRYLVACANTDIEPVLLLNKTDLITDTNREALHTLLAHYANIGYATRMVSAQEKQLADLNAIIQQQTVVFVGQSGVGKSSIINVLLPDAAQRVAAISQNSKLGQHTTTTARLFHLPEGGDLIDSPGIREFGLWHMTDEELLKGYREFQAHLGTCRFRNCIHKNEPGCALKLAVESGEISAQRFERFQKLREELKKPDY